MGAVIHRSQRRVSCEACRKTKAKCQRVQPTDSQCARCFLMKIDCVAGEQKKVGRPRRTASDRATHRDEHRVEAMSWAKDYSTSENPKYSSAALASPYRHDQATLVSPKPSIVDSLAVVGADAAAWQYAIFDVDASSSWDTSWELDLASFASAVSTSPYGQNNLSSYSSLTDSSPRSSEGGSPRPLEIQHSSHADTLSEFHRISLDLHIRAAAIEHHKGALTLDMIIYQQGPLFIDGTTLAELLLKASQDFLDTLARLQDTQPRAILSPTPLPSFTLTELSSPLHPRPRIAHGPLSGPLALAITSVFAQLVELWELTIKQLSTRLERIGIEPIAPIPGLNFGGVQTQNPCIQGMLFTNMAVHLMERMERTLGIAGGPASGEGLLSPQQMDVLWSELGGENGDTNVGMLRPKLLKKAFNDTAMIMREVSFRRP